MIDPLAAKYVCSACGLFQLVFFNWVFGALMAFHVFHTDREFTQTALDMSARIIFDRASEILSMGNCVPESVTALSVLSNAAVFAGYSNTAINVYYEILETENKNSGDYDDK